MTPWVTRLIIANVAMFIVSVASPAFADALAFVPAFILLRPWTLVTYMFLHGGLWHILFNMLGLWFFGPRLEEELGGNRFLVLYFVSGLMGAFFSFLFAFHSPIIGASAAVYGVLLGFARFWPREKLLVWGIVPVEARWMVVIMTALSLWGGLGGPGEGIAHFAHLGGFVGGYAYLVLLERTSRAARFRRQSAPAPARSSDIQRWTKINREALHEVNRTEYDRIMEKIRTAGIGALTEGERMFLDRFSGI
jgi:membrane associated rhomboid family serine protease